MKPLALVLLPAALSALLASGCDSAATTPLPAWPAATCGVPATTWLPRAQVGHVVSWADAQRTLLTAPTIDVLIAAAGASELFAPAAHGIQMFTLRYTTQDRGRPVEATGLVAVPWDDGQPAQSFPVVLFTHGTTGFMGACAPSHTQGDGDVFPLLLLASLGYVVVAPDYIGLDAGADFTQPPAVRHNYLGVEQTAIGSLDMVRAARELLGGGKVETMARPTTNVILWGGSQGGHAVFANDLVAPYYAPELTVRAAVALVPATDLVGLAEYALGSVNDATGAFAAMLTTMHYWYGEQAALDTVLTTTAPWSFATEVPSAIYGGCDASGKFDGVTAVTDVYQPDFIAAVTSGQATSVSPWGCYLAENSVPWTSIQKVRTTPTLFVTSGNDTLIHTPVERADFPRLCGMGYALQYLECEGAQHPEGAVWSLPEQVAWVKDRLAGKPIAAADLCVLKPAVRCSAQPQP
ncbi:MAG TPA: lipase family protein [Polyangia bacterium]|jgi:hypothetical protein